MSYFIFTLLCSLLVETHICAAQLYCYSIGLRDLFSSSSIFYLISFSCLNLGYRLIWKRKLHVLTALVSRLFCTVKVLLILSANSVSCWKCKKFQYKYSKSEASWCENERSQTWSVAKLKIKHNIENQWICDLDLFELVIPFWHDLALAPYSKVHTRLLSIIWNMLLNKLSSFNIYYNWTGTSISIMHLC